MKAVRLIQVGQPLATQEIPVPPIGDRDVLVRVRAAGICHSDAHYRAGTSPVRTPPVTLGHEVAGVVEQAGSEVTAVTPGDRVALHYLVTCGACRHCASGHEQFCPTGAMIGKHRDGGYADYIAVPARNAVLLPDAIPFEQGAILMCSSATSFHALRRSRLRPGETAAIFGLGGLGISAVQLARAFGALEVYAVDISTGKLALAQQYGAIPVDARAGDPVAEIQRLTGGRGVDVAVELIGLPPTMRQAVQSLAVLGRAAIAGITRQPFEIYSYGELLGKEAEVLGVDDHLLAELPLLIDYVRRGILDLSRVVTATVPLDAPAINCVLDGLERYSSDVRTVIVDES
jgi:D-arabinose 1-dehydrogenase-like Zn-dependent alcohol dehydrogenase